MAWVDVDTGELYEEPRPGAVEVDLPDAPEDEPELVEFVLKQAVQLKAVLGVLKEQHAKRVAEVNAQLKSLDWLYRSRLEAQVKLDLKAQGGKKKSVNYAHGKAGWSKRTSKVVVDEEAAIAWAIFEAPDAVKTTQALLKGNLPKGVEVPGVEVKTNETFFFRA